MPHDFPRPDSRADHAQPSVVTANLRSMNDRLRMFGNNVERKVRTPLERNFHFRDCMLLPPPGLSHSRAPRCGGHGSAAVPLRKSLRQPVGIVLTDRSDRRETCDTRWRTCGDPRECVEIDHLPSFSAHRRRVPPIDARERC